MFITADRFDGRPVDPIFETDLRSWVDPYRLAGHDLEVDEPRLVALDVAMRVCVAVGHFREHVEAALRERLGNRLNADGTTGFFHPDRFTFGQPVYLSGLTAAAMDVPGVQWVQVVRFQRLGVPPDDELETGVLRTGRLEVAELAGSERDPDRGRLELIMDGGQ